MGEENRRGDPWGHEWLRSSVRSLEVRSPGLEKQVSGAPAFDGDLLRSPPRYSIWFIQHGSILLLALGVATVTWGTAKSGSAVRITFFAVAGGFALGLLGSVAWGLLDLRLRERALSWFRSWPVRVSPGTSVITVGALVILGLQVLSIGRSAREGRTEKDEQAAPELHQG